LQQHWKTYLLHLVQISCEVQQGLASLQIMQHNYTKFHCLCVNLAGYRSYRHLNEFDFMTSMLEIDLWHLNERQQQAFVGLAVTFGQGLR